jgi:maltose-binding protein MalE
VRQRFCGASPPISRRTAGTKVVVNNMDHEAHKTAIRNYLVAGAPDVCFWFSGNRMRGFVTRGLFDDISDLFEKEKYADVLGATAGSVTVEGKQYGLPTGGTLWGMFYRKDVFDEHGLKVPASWDDFLAFGEKCKSASLTPVAMGTKDLWPAAGWFDQMNLRINGLDKHFALMNGEMAYTDETLKPVFDHWEELIKQGFFTPDHTSFGWQEAGAFLAQKRAGMMNLGAFVRAAFPQQDLPQLTFAPFPVIDDGLGRYEEFSLNSVHIPANAKNKSGAREFLVHISTGRRTLPPIWSRAATFRRATTCRQARIRSSTPPSRASRQLPAPRNSTTGTPIPTWLRPALSASRSSWLGRSAGTPSCSGSKERAGGSSSSEIFLNGIVGAGPLRSRPLPPP